MNIEFARLFLGYCTLINFSMLLLATVALSVFREKITNLHASMFNVDHEVVRNMYISYLAMYKILIIVFNLVPYIVLYMV